jgi:hypothetical protein
MTKFSIRACQAKARRRPVAKSANAHLLLVVVVGVVFAVFVVACYCCLLF